jgi:hypothetical protein
VDEVLAWIIPNPTVLQLQCGMPKFANFNIGDIEIEGLTLDMEAMLRHSPTMFHELRIVLGRPIPGNHMDLAAANRLLHEIDVFQHPHIDSRNFPCMMAAHNVIDLVQSNQVIIPASSR